MKFTYRAPRFPEFRDRTVWELKTTCQDLHYITIACELPEERYPAWFRLRQRVRRWLGFRTLPAPVIPRSFDLRIHYEFCLTTREDGLVVLDPGEWRRQERLALYCIGF